MIGSFLSTLIHFSWLSTAIRHVWNIQKAWLLGFIWHWLVCCLMACLHEACKVCVHNCSPLGLDLPWLQKHWGFLHPLHWLWDPSLNSSPEHGFVQPAGNYDEHVENSLSVALKVIALFLTTAWIDPVRNTLSLQASNSEPAWNLHLGLHDAIVECACMHRIAPKALLCVR